MRDGSQEPVWHVDEQGSNGLVGQVGTLQWLVMVQHLYANTT